MMWNRKVFIRIIEVLLCIACVVALRVTDDESRRVFHYLRNRSREWSLLNNVTWGSIGAALATATCGGYIIITVGLLIAAVTGELSGRITELFLLGLGVILFGVVGSLSLASIESVPEDLIDNAAVLGALCLVTALVFIADLLMSAPGLKKKHDGTQTFLDKETASSIKPSTMPTLSLESESRAPKTTASENGAATSTGQLGKKAGTANDVFDDSDEPRRARNIDDEPAPSSSQERDHEAHFSKVQRPKVTEVRSDERDRGYEADERQSREYAAQNFENGRTLRDSQRFRDPERDRRDDNKIVRNLPRIDRDEGKIFYQGQDFRQRPADELDTPLFPATRDSMPEPMFAKIVNPSVKIMRVDRDPEDTYDTRYSDSSQYDNVPTRINGHPEGILKRRDVSVNVPSSLRAYRAQAGPNKDDIEMLEEWINVLKTTTGSQTGRSPSSPTDPGYVRHTVSNWPRELKSKTPSASPERPTSNR